MKKILITLAIGLLGIVVYLNQPKPSFDTIKAPTVTYKQDPQILSEAKQLGIDVSKVNLEYTNDFKNVNLVDKSTVRGMFAQPNTIYIKPGITDELRTLGHEYLHYIWYNNSIQETNRVSLQIRPVFLNPQFKNLLSNYPQDQSVLDNEEHSIVCTSISPYQLSDEINSYCNKLIPGRNLLLP